MYNSTAKQIPLKSAIRLTKGTTGLKQPTHSLIVHTEQYIEIIPQEEIRYLKAESNYTCITLLNGHSILASKTMGTYEKLLSQKLFIRCHQSFVVNIKEIRRIKKTGNMELYLTDKTIIPVSRSKKKMVLHTVTNL